MLLCYCLLNSSLNNTQIKPVISIHVNNPNSVLAIVHFLCRTRPSVYSDVQNSQDDSLLVTIQVPLVVIVLTASKVANSHVTRIKNSKVRNILLRLF